MNHTASASARQPVDELTPEDTRDLPTPAGETGGRPVLYLRVLWEKRRTLARAAVVGFVVGALVAALIPSQYESTSRLMPPDNQSNSGLAMLAALTSKTGGALGSVAGDLLGIKTSGALFVGVVRSQTLQDRIVDRFQLKRVYSVRLQEDARNKLADDTVVSEDRKSGIISITVTDGDPKRAAAIAQAYADELNVLVAELSTSSARRERVFLEDRLKAVKQDLDNASREFSQFSSKNNTLDIKEQARAMLQSAAALEGQLIAAESQLKGLEEIYTDSNVRVRAVKARIAELHHQLEKFSGKSTPDSNAATDNSSDSLYPTIRRLPILGVTYADLYRRLQIQETVFGVLTQQYELAKVQEAKEIPSVKVLDAGRVPEKKSFPPRALISVAGGFLGFGLVAVVVLVGSAWDEVASNDPSKVLAKEVAHTVNAYMPWVQPNGSRVQAATHKIWVRLTRRRNGEGPFDSSDFPLNRP